MDKLFYNIHENKLLADELKMEMSLYCRPFYLLWLCSVIVVGLVLLLFCVFLLFVCSLEAWGVGADKVFSDKKSTF